MMQAPGPACRYLKHDKIAVVRLHRKSFITLAIGRNAKAAVMKGASSQG